MQNENKIYKALNKMCKFFLWKKCNKVQKEAGFV